MPALEIAPSRLCNLIGQKLSFDELTKILAEIGCDAEPDPTTGVLKLNLLPARPDLFDACGLARCIKGYLGIETGFKVYNLKKSNITIRVEKDVLEVRPFIAGAIVKGLMIEEELLMEVMALQENLHWGLGRDRRRASIGIYDLATVEPDFIYRTVKPDGVKFIPLDGIPDRSGVAVTPEEILAFHPKGKAHRHLLKGFPRYPLLIDRTGKVLSLPPIINSEETKVSLTTKDLFIDVTGWEEWVVRKTIDVLGASLADLGGEVFKVTVVYPDGQVWETPVMQPEEMEIDLKDVKDVIGIEIEGERIIHLLKRMRFDAEIIGREKGKGFASTLIKVLIPPYRADILHPWDIIEDIAIAYGYHNIPPKPVSTVTVSAPLIIEEFSSLCRDALIGLGFIEIMSLCLTNPEMQFDKLGRRDDGLSVLVKNPVSTEQRMLRRHLLSGVLETFSRNATQPLPQNIFEIGDVFEIDQNSETGSRTRRHIAIGIADAKAGFSDIKAVIDAFARELNFPLLFTAKEEMPFLTGRCAEVYLSNGTPVGIAGEVHPEILERFNLTVPVVLAELDIDLLLNAPS